MQISIFQYEQMFRRIRNKCIVIFADVQCPVLNLPRPPLIGKIEGARMGHGATFECPIGFKLEGAAGITCQYNGKGLYMCT